MADHFANSSDAADLAKALRYSEMAAGRAMTVYAYGEAARLLEQALQVQEVMDPDDTAKRCDLLIALGDALNNSAEPRRVLDLVAPEALSLAEGMGDGVRASRVCVLAIWSLTYCGGPGAFTTPEAVQWSERADRYAQPDTVERVWTDWGLTGARFSEGRHGEGLALIAAPRIRLTTERGAAPKFSSGSEETIAELSLITAIRRFILPLPLMPPTEVKS